MRAPFLVVGHRGAPTVEVENTIPSYERAVAVDGADGIELDVCVTRDGHVVVWHDFRPDGFEARLRRWGLEPAVRCRPVVPSDRARRRPVDELTLAELRRWYGYADKKGLTDALLPVEIPTLDQAFEWGARHRALHVIFVDIKIPEDRAHLLPVLLRRVDALVERLRPSFQVVLETTSPAFAEELSRMAPRYGCTLDVMPPPGVAFGTKDSSAVRAAIAHRLTHATPQRPRSITFRPFATHRRIVEHDVARMRRHNASEPARPLEGICAFTINDEHEMRELVLLGVSAIQSDRPHVLRRVVDEHFGTRDLAADADVARVRASAAEPSSAVEDRRRDRVARRLREEDAVAVMPRREEEARQR